MGAHVDSPCRVWMTPGLSYLSVHPENSAVGLCLLRGAVPSRAAEELVLPAQLEWVLSAELNSGPAAVGL